MNALEILFRIGIVLGMVGLVLASVSACLMTLIER